MLSAVRDMRHPSMETQLPGTRSPRRRIWHGLHRLLERSGLHLALNGPIKVTAKGVAAVDAVPSTAAINLWLSKADRCWRTCTL